MMAGGLEKKIALLEQRLVLMERFVELRFSETFRDFSIRNLSSSSVVIASEEEPADKVKVVTRPRPTTRLSNSGGKRKSPREEEIPSTSASSTGKRELRIQVVRLDGSQGGDQHNLEETQNDPPHPVKISREDEADIEEEDAGGDQENDDDYFMFGGVEVDDDGGDGGDDEVDDPLGVGAVDSDDHDWSEAEVTSPPKRKRRSRGTRASTDKPKVARVRKPCGPSSYRMPPGGIKLVNGKSPDKLMECPVCHSHWKSKANYDKHLETCLKERTMKCRFENCGKAFFTRKAVRKHEKLHEREKWEKGCRVGGGCGVKMVDPAHLLAHERNCIRRVLGKGGRVEEDVLEDVKRRSVNFEVGDLKVAPSLDSSEVGVGGDGGDGDLKKCKYCEERVGRKEYLRHLDKHRTWKCGLCVGDGGDEGEGELSRAFVEKKGLVRHIVHFHGLSSRKANDKAVEVEEEQEVTGGEGEQGGGMGEGNVESGEEMVVT